MNTVLSILGAIVVFAFGVSYIGERSSVSVNSVLYFENNSEEIESKILVDFSFRDFRQVKRGHYGGSSFVIDTLAAKPTAKVRPLTQRPVSKLRINSSIKNKD